MAVLDAISRRKSELSLGLDGAQKFDNAVNENSSGGSGVGGATNTAITTVGAGTLTAAAIVGGIITRSGSTAAYTDTTATASQIGTAIGGTFAGNEKFEVKIRNTVGFNQTITGGTGVTVTGVSIVPPNSVGTFLVTFSSTTAATMVGLGASPLTTAPLAANTAISTVGAGTLTAAGIVGGLITRSGSIAAYSDATDTAVAIIAALPNVSVGYGFYFSIKNTVGFNETVTAGAGVTLAGQVIVPPFSVGLFHCKVTAATTVTITGVSMVPLTSVPLEVDTAISTAGAGTLTAAGIAGRLITRTGASAAYTDTTDTGTAIVAALPNANVGDAFEFTIKNMVAFPETLAVGVDVTLAGLTVVPPLSVGRFLVKVTAATTVTITGISMAPLVNLPPTQYTVGALATGTLTAGQITGAQHVYLETTTDGAASMTTRTAAEMFGDIPNCQIGFTFKVTLINSGNNTLTLVAGSNVTATGTLTVATTTTRTFACVFTSATALTMQVVDKGTVEAT